jgi:hypothetical protein
LRLAYVPQCLEALRATVLCVVEIFQERHPNNSFFIIINYITAITTIIMIITITIIISCPSRAANFREAENELE